MKKILLFSFFFPPFNNMASRRWAQMIPELSKEYDIYIFTNNGVGDLPVPISEKKIFRCGYLQNPAFRIQNYVRESRLHKIISIFTEKMRAIDSTILTWFWRNRTIIQKYTKFVNPNIIITTIGPVSNALIGKFVQKRNSNIIWILDVRDILGPFDMNNKKWWQHRVDMIFEKYAVSKPDIIFAAGKYYAYLLREFYNQNVEILYNGFLEKEITISNDDKSSEKINIYYAGKIYPHQEKSLKLLLITLNKKDYILNFRLVGSRNQLIRFKNYLELRNINNVNLLKPEKAKIIFYEQKKSDVLVLFEDLDTTSRATKGTLTGKIFEYLRSGPPIMAICRKDSEISELLAETNRGAVVSSSDEIIKFIKDMDKFKLKSANQIIKYSRENQARRFIKLLREKYNV